MIENDFIEVDSLESINGTLSVFSIVVLMLIKQTFGHIEVATDCL